MTDPLASTGERRVVSLIGMPGSGKSTVGKELAKRLGVPFADADKAVERRAGCTVARLFERDGEATFRDLEGEALAALVDSGPSVIATGGGAVLRSVNRDLLRTRTRCVYLAASPELLWRRVRRDRRRPLLQVADPEARLRQLALEREPFYLETAALVIEIDSLPFDRMVDEVLARLGADSGLR